MGKKGKDPSKEKSTAGTETGPSKAGTGTGESTAGTETGPSKAGTETGESTAGTETIPCTEEERKAAEEKKGPTVHDSGDKVINLEDKRPKPPPANASLYRHISYQIKTGQTANLNLTGKLAASLMTDILREKLGTDFELSQNTKDALSDMLDGADTSEWVKYFAEFLARNDLILASGSFAIFLWLDIKEHNKKHPENVYTSEESADDQSDIVS